MIWSAAWNEKFQVIISTIGFIPNIAIPMAAPVKPPSAIGVSITRFGPNFSSKPSVTTWVPP